MPTAHEKGGIYGLYGILRLMGAVQGPMFPTSSVYLARWMPKAKPGEPDEKAWGTSMLDVGISIGTLFIIPVVKFLVEAVGWRHTYHIVGLVSLGYCALFQIFAASSPSECWYISKGELEHLKKKIFRRRSGRWSERRRVALLSRPHPKGGRGASPAKKSPASSKTPPKSRRGSSPVKNILKSPKVTPVKKATPKAAKATSDDKSGLCYKIVGMPFHVATSPGLWAVFGAHMAFNFGAYYLTNWSSVYYNDVLDVVPKDSAYHLMMPNITNLIAKSLTPTINAFLAKRGYSLLKCRKLFTCSGFMLAAASITTRPLHRRTVQGNHPIDRLLLDRECDARSLSPSGFKANYLEITEEYVGIIAGYGNTLGTVASFVQPKIIDYVLSTTGSWAIVLATVCAVNTALASINYALHATVDPIEAEEGLMQDAGRVFSGLVPVVGGSVKCVQWCVFVCVCVAVWRERLLGHVRYNEMDMGASGSAVERGYLVLMFGCKLTLSAHTLTSRSSPIQHSLPLHFLSAHSNTTLLSSQTHITHSLLQQLLSSLLRSASLSHFYLTTRAGRP